jgi:hypothetical protein
MMNLSHKKEENHFPATCFALRYGRKRKTTGHNTFYKTQQYFRYQMTVSYPLPAAFVLLCHITGAGR